MSTPEERELVNKLDWFGEHDLSGQVFALLAERDKLKAQRDALVAEGRKLVDWLDRLAARAEENAKDKRFISLAEANAADAKNYRATAKGMRAALEGEK